MRTIPGEKTNHLTRVEPRILFDDENMLRQTGGPRLVRSFVPVHNGILRPLKRASQEASRQNFQVLEAKTASAFRAIRWLGRIGMKCDSYLWQVLGRSMKKSIFSGLFLAWASARAGNP